MTNFNSPVDHQDDRPSLSMNERIVWISDTGPEYGNVRWLGRLPDLGREWMAGVEFDNPVGSGTGLYKDQQLFVTPLNHASLVPVIGLLKASDFDGPPEVPAKGSFIKLVDRYQSPSVDEELPNSRLALKQRYEESPNSQDLFSKLHDRVERLSRERLATSRVREIPIRIEQDNDNVNHIDERIVHTSTNNLSSSTKRSTTPNELIHRPPVVNRIGNFAKPSASRDMGRYNEIVSAMEQSSLEDNRITQNDSITARQASLCPPALVAKPGDKNPALTLKNMLGKNRGIQGHNNSCYLDATLFAMFSTTTFFDSLLNRPAAETDIPEYNEVQRILREDIVKPLREEYFVSADQVMRFRTMLEEVSSVSGLTDEEKDPEEFLSLLLGQVLKSEPYLKLSSGLESFFYQLLPEKDEHVVLPSMQDLIEQSFIYSPIRLREIPACLILQLPRDGRQYKMYTRIRPSLKLDITDVLEAAPRACGHRDTDCDNIARYECRDCFREGYGRSSMLSSSTYCDNCFDSKHFGKTHETGIEYHNQTKTHLSLTPNEAISRFSNRISKTRDREIPRICMDLFAVLCIETSHYVCFVKCGQEPDSPWCFFDSMADRKGEQNGYNIPEVVLFEDFAFWTSDAGASHLLTNKDDKLLPEKARRLICDASLCFYRYNGLSTYR